MAFFDKAYNTPASQAVYRGDPIDVGTIGPYPRAATDVNAWKNAFVNKIKRNPGGFNLSNNSVFPQDKADEAQDAIDAAAQTNNPRFRDPGDTKLAKDFTDKYIASILIEDDKKINKEGLAGLARQPATAGSSDKDPNTANKFPGEGGTQVG